MFQYLVLYWILKYTSDLYYYDNTEFLELEDYRIEICDPDNSDIEDQLRESNCYSD